MEKNKVMDEVLGDTLDLTTSDLYSADFPTAFRGFDKVQVRSFLERAADAFDALQRQVTDLKQASAAHKEQLERYQAMEASLAAALASAQTLNETTIAQARREADLIREEARLARESAKKHADSVPEALRDEINELRAMRKRLKSDLRAVLDIHGALLRGDGDYKSDYENFMPADGAAYLNASGDDDHDLDHGHGHADISVIEPDTEDAGHGRKE